MPAAPFCRLGLIAQEPSDYIGRELNDFSFDWDEPSQQTISIPKSFALNENHTVPSASNPEQPHPASEYIPPAAFPQLGTIEEHEV